MNEIIEMIYGERRRATRAGRTFLCPACLEKFGQAIEGISATGYCETCGKDCDGRPEYMIPSSSKEAKRVSFRRWIDACPIARAKKEAERER